LSEDFNNYPQNQCGDAYDQSHRVHPGEANDQEEDQQQNEELPYQLKEGVFLLGHYVLAQNAPEPMKIEQGNPPAQDQAQGYGPALKPKTCQEQDNQNLGASFLDGDELPGFLVAR
jgi:hypothetical protein